MLKQFAAALFAASIAVAPALAVDAGPSKPATETGKPAPQANVKPTSQANVKPAKHVRHHVRHHRHVAHVRTKHVKHAKHLNGNKGDKLSTTNAPKGMGQTTTMPASK
jgi:hypothetical protein